MASATRHPIRNRGMFLLLVLAVHGVVLMLLLLRGHVTSSDRQSSTQPTGPAHPLQPLAGMRPTESTLAVEGAASANTGSSSAGAQVPGDPQLRAAASGTHAACGAGDPASASFIPGWQTSRGTTIQNGTAFSPGPWVSGPEMVRLDKEVVWNGSFSAYIKTRTFGSAVLWQAVDATPYRTQRVEVSAFVRPASSRGMPTMRAWASSGHADSIPWAAQLPGPAVPVTGPELTGGWRRLSAQVDVPFDSELLFYGFAGPMWIDHVEVVIVPVVSAWGEKETDPYPESLFPHIPIASGSILPAPTNLDFEEEGAVLGCAVSPDH